jgi:hypothetical protein
MTVNRPSAPRGGLSGATAWCLAAVLAGGLACGDTNVVTGSYNTLEEAVAEGAVARGSVPRGLPPGARDIREAYDPGAHRRWGLFEFPPDEAPALRARLGPERPLTGERVSPPRRVEWWPLLLRGDLDPERLAATGLEVYDAREGGLAFAVNWKQGRAYYWAADQ